ncbi:NAD(P)H-dependent oxidoreductase [Roseomonas sp. JC162]|uniref:NAD(P)H-dependent oxidoreductase n=1 Tax=Neoroseomonas marina TaxID=1232220 RepID=A0A848E612_9PROT|nr:NADPH-dependent FMN reductase [Neoroseomonas marina]NMJ39841.1 NAD(P)H-dependent oxidoreductase [Neoroseomonas marina]
MPGPAIAVVIGSLRKASFNRRLATALMRIGPAEFTFTEAPIGALPLYNQDEEATPTPALSQFRAQIRAAQGVLFVTPEYNRSIPGVLKNAIDQGSRPAGQSVWGGKPAGIVGTSPGAAGSAMAQQHLRNVLAMLNVAVLPSPEVFLQFKEGLIAEDGSIADERTAKFLQGWMDRYAAWVRRFAA